MKICLNLDAIALILTPPRQAKAAAPLYLNEMRIDSGRAWPEATHLTRIKLPVFPAYFGPNIFSQAQPSLPPYLLFISCLTCSLQAFLSLLRQVKEAAICSFPRMFLELGAEVQTKSALYSLVEEAPDEPLEGAAAGAAEPL